MVLYYVQRWPDGEELLVSKEAGGVEKAVIEDKFLRLQHFQQPVFHVSSFSAQFVL